MRILIIGSHHQQIVQASAIASRLGAAVTHAPDSDKGIASLCSGKSADVVMADVNMDIAGLIDSLATQHISIPVIAYGIDVESDAPARAIEEGAQEYIPFPPDAELIAAVLEAISNDGGDGFIASSPAMARIFEMADKIAPSSANVLITGESGTGKEVMARYIHDNSKRASHPFISVNCAAIPENLLESELFGHEKGAFTGATQRRIGKFEESGGGTLLLDEISEMDFRLQAKLLRALQEKEIDRVGGKSPVQVDLRVLATSNRDLQEEVKNGTFREDLLFRLNVIHLELPPLRNRREDIPAFAQHFVAKYSEANGVAERPIAEDAMERLTSYHWPGNVREMENTMHRAVLLADGDEIGNDAIILSREEEVQAQRSFITDNTPDDEPVTEHYSAHAQDTGDIARKLVGKSMDEVEQAMIIGTLDHCLGNRTHAANILGISIRTLRNKLKTYEEIA